MKQVREIIYSNLDSSIPVVYPPVPCSIILFDHIRFDLYGELAGIQGGQNTEVFTTSCYY
jgi:hypothetical protein